MRSWKIASISGIDIELHWTTLLFIISLIILSPISAIVLTLLFIIISLHELSHSIVAKRRGIDVRRIVLLPIGGMAVMEESNLKPEDEFYMAFAGPAFNFIFAGIVLLFVQLLGLPIYSMHTWDLMMNGKINIEWLGFIVSNLFWLNWLLGAFNLFIPAIPMDGGRVLRAFLAMTMDYSKATRIAGYVSKFLIAFMLMFSIFTFNIILFLIAIFLWIGASAEVEQAMNTHLVSMINMKNLIKKRAPKISQKILVKKALETMLKKNTTQLFVGDNIHFVTVEDLVNANKNDYVMNYARIARPIEITRPDVMINSFMAQNAEILPVKINDEIVGFIYLDDLTRAMKLAKMLYA